MRNVYRIKSNLDVNGTHWGLEFHHGEATTERDDLARRLRSLGYRVEELKNPAIDKPADELDADPATDSEDVISCPVCGKEIGSKGALTRHMNKEHPEHN